MTEVGPGSEPFSVDVISHRPTGYFFKFDVDHSQASLWAIYNPGRDGMQRREHAGTWEYVFGYVQQWLGFVRQEHEAPDLWAELGRQRGALADHAVENTPFSLDEQAQIAADLTEAKEYLRANPELESGQLELIEAQLDYLVEAARRVGRIDWRNLLVGSMLSLVLQAAVPVAPVQHLLFIMLRGLAQMFGGGPPELPGA